MPTRCKLVEVCQSQLLIPPTRLQTLSIHGKLECLEFCLIQLIDQAQVHQPDRTTRKLAPLAGPLPLILSLTGSGSRGSAEEAIKV
jgi:hypothetical protein